MAQSPSRSAGPNSFGARADLTVGDRSYEIYRINALADRFAVGRLPYSVKVLLENLLRHEDGLTVHASDVEAVADWGRNPERHGFGGADSAEIALTPERVLMQDFTGVPGVVDLAAMRDALRVLGGDPARVNPLVPVELVIDHSVIAEVTGTPTAYDQNVDIEYQRNIERYQLLRWAQEAFDGFRVVPPARAFATRSISSTCPGWSSPPTTGAPTVTPWSGPTRTPPWSTGSASSGGAWGASRPRRPCWASPCPCSSPLWSGSG